jgi:1,2-diacylglycerol 3-beta-galactosyltransferase
MASFNMTRLFPRIPSPGSKMSKNPKQRGTLGAFALAMMLAVIALLSRKAADRVHSPPGGCSPARVLIMTSATGGGHGAAAAAIKHGLEALDPSLGHFDVRVQDMFADHCPWPLSEFPGTYKFLMKNPWMWRAIYYSSQYGTAQLMKAITFLIKPFAHQEILDREPDVIVSVHPMMQHVPIKMLSQAGRPPCQPEDVDSIVEQELQPCTPFVTVVTDTETGSNLWFHPGVTRAIVPDGKLASRAKQHGLRDAQLRQANALLVSAQFSVAARLNRRRVREELGLCLDCPVLLLMGGGDGAGNMDHYAWAIHRELARSTDTQIVVVCGRNAELRSRLGRQLNASHVGGRRQARILGFRRDMALWMRASDLLLTKAGPSTIAEALTVGLPVLLYGYLPGQERGNVDLVVRNRVGAYTPGAHNSAWTAKTLLFERNGTALQEMRERVKGLSYGTSATDLVVGEVAHLAAFSKRLREARL